MDFVKGIWCMQLSDNVVIEYLGPVQSHVLVPSIKLVKKTEVRMDLVVSDNFAIEYLGFCSCSCCPMWSVAVYAPLNMELHCSYLITCIDLCRPVSVSINNYTKTKPEAESFENHAVHHVQIPEAE
ncbi:hypothetical protein DAPPUDRAFT_321842 [Daphnia pulex]|uniref:Uncharacterized protein n=1 Tax=Daphnia pulex TaxID=6669 RepID=E9GU28_DAPPU|nr:hypothetical protein DAPPUDRAFT_321841 [Daphnia pulex]EFX77047.1 hypothetical protein DAPPUDRAFT_321842 [Daphnia pulex]|eukprot:EFX76965.1 hypothetical protein DAPPUDRAFT_321841 [Daphnia pulex]